MKRTLQTILFALVAMMVPIGVWAKTEIDGIKYNLNSTTSTAEVIGLASGEGNVDIPESVDYDGTTYSVTSIGEQAFERYTNLTSITIPESVTSIGRYAFEQCTNLTSITIPNSVTSIGYGAFRYCSSLTSITIPNSVTNMGDFTFGYCEALTSITIPESVTSIGGDVFYACTGLTSVTIPNSVTSIGGCAFYACTGLTSITIPESVTSIKNHAFWDCGLTSITIPNSVTSIGVEAFLGCKNLTSITVMDGNTVYDSRDNCNALIETASNTLILGCKTTVIPNSVTSIGDRAFGYYEALTSITIPESVTSIGNCAFWACSSLTTITLLPTTPPTLGDGVFGEVNDQCVLYVPEGAVEAYQVAEGYSVFGDNIRVIGDDVSVHEAKWGTSAEAESFEYGTLEEAFEAACSYNSNTNTYESTDVAYIQLQRDVISEYGHFVYGGTFTFDLNGKTLQSNAHTLSIRGGEVTITDGSTEKSGKVITTENGCVAVQIPSYGFSPKITIEGGQYKSNNQDAVSIESISCEVTINGGEFATTDFIMDLITNHGTLTINGGTFDATNANYAVYISEKTVINGGTFVGAQIADVEYHGGSLEINAVEATDETPGFSPMGLSVAYKTEDASSFSLPEGYGFYNSDDEAVTDFESGTVYYIGKEEGAGYTVTFSANYDTEATMDDATVTSPTGKYTLPECTFTAPEGMVFEAWLVGEAEYQPGDEIVVTSDTEVKAVWTTYVPQIVIKMYDTYGDGWNGATITVKKDGEEFGTATINNGHVAKFTYDFTCEYAFYWTKGDYDVECSFEIYVEEELEFAATTDDCNGFEDNQLIHTIEVGAISEVSIADGELTEYSCKKSIVGTLTYTRTLPNLVWNALYVPFEIPMSMLANYDVAYINDVHSYDDDEDGEIDDLKMEVIKITTGTLKANYPYLIRAKKEEAKAMSIVLTDATLYATEENTVTCSSVFMRFDVTGTYSQMSTDDLDGSLVITSDGGWKQLAENSVLRPFRLYLTMTAIDGSPVKVSEQAARAMRIVARGESEGTTSIDNGQLTIHNSQFTIDNSQLTIDNSQLTIDNSQFIYDLMGRRVLEPQKGSVYIVNGKKVVW